MLPRINNGTGLFVSEEARMNRQCNYRLAAGRDLRTIRIWRGVRGEVGGVTVAVIRAEARTGRGGIAVGRVIRGPRRISPRRRLGESICGREGHQCRTKKSGFRKLFHVENPFMD